MSITQLASFNPRQLKQFSRSQINALPDALWNRLNRGQTRALVNAYSSRRISSRRVDSEEVSSQRSSDVPKRRIADLSGPDLTKEAAVSLNQFEPWLDVGALAPGRQSAEEELMAMHNPLGDAQSDLPLSG